MAIIRIIKRSTRAFDSNDQLKAEYDRLRSQASRLKVGPKTRQLIEAGQHLIKSHPDDDTPLRDAIRTLKKIIAAKGEGYDVGVKRSVSKR